MQKKTQKEKDSIHHDKSPFALKSTFKISRNESFVKLRC